MRHACFKRRSRPRLRPGLGIGRAERRPCRARFCAARGSCGRPGRRAAGPDRIARLPRQTGGGAGMPARLHPLRRLWLCRAGERRRGRGRTRLRLLAGLRVWLSHRRVSRFHARQPPPAPLCRVAQWPWFSPQDGFPPDRQVCRARHRNGTCRRVWPQVDAAPAANHISARRRSSLWQTAFWRGFQSGGIGT